MGWGAVLIYANSWVTRSLTVAACWGQLTVWGVIRIWRLLVGSAQGTWLVQQGTGQKLLFSNPEEENRRTLTLCLIKSTGSAKLQVINKRFLLLLSRPNLQFCRSLVKSGNGEDSLKKGC